MYKTNVKTLPKSSVINIAEGSSFSSSSSAASCPFFQSSNSTKNKSKFVLNKFSV